MDEAAFRKISDWVGDAVIYASRRALRLALHPVIERCAGRRAR
jgi:hypothetical protein